MINMLFTRKTMKIVKSTRRVLWGVIPNMWMLQWYETILAMNHNLMTNNLNGSFKLHAPFLNTSFKIFSRKMKDEYWRDGFDCTKRPKIKPEVNTGLFKGHIIWHIFHNVLWLFPNRIKLCERSSVQTCPWSCSKWRIPSEFRQMTKSDVQKTED